MNKKVLNNLLLDLDKSELLELNNRLILIKDDNITILFNFFKEKYNIIIKQNEKEISNLKSQKIIICKQLCNKYNITYTKLDDSVEELKPILEYSEIRLLDDISSQLIKLHNKNITLYDKLLEIS